MRFTILYIYKMLLTRLSFLCRFIPSILLRSYFTNSHGLKNKNKIFIQPILNKINSNYLLCDKIKKRVYSLNQKLRKVAKTFGGIGHLKTINVVAAIIKKNNQILIAQRLKGEFAGQWEFPGGKVEPGETYQQALKREIMEEMELSINVGDYLTTVQYDYSTFHLTMECYMCSLENEEIHLHDHTAIRWISLSDDIKHINWVPADIQVIHAVQKRYG